MFLAEGPAVLWKKMLDNFGFFICEHWWYLDPQSGYQTLSCHFWEVASAGGTVAWMMDDWSLGLATSSHTHRERDIYIYIHIDMHVYIYICAHKQIGMCTHVQFVWSPTAWLAAPFEGPRVFEVRDNQVVALHPSTGITHKPEWVSTSETVKSGAMGISYTGSMTTETSGFYCF
jgi:hypothetical protein